MISMLSKNQSFQRMGFIQTIGNIQSTGNIQRIKTFNLFEKNYSQLNQNNNLIKINVNLTNGNLLKVQGQIGDSLIDILNNQKNKDNIELNKHVSCHCKGKMNCLSCHIYLDEKNIVFSDVAYENDIDNEILNSLPNKMDNSKLGCKLRLESYHNDMHIFIP